MPAGCGQEALPERKTLLMSHYLLVSLPCAQLICLCVCCAVKGEGTGVSTQMPARLARQEAGTAVAKH